MLLLATISCQRVPVPVPLDGLAERYVRAALKLAAHRPSLVESWRGPQAWKPAERQPVAAIRQEIQTLAQDVTARAQHASVLDDHARLAYLRGQLGALDLAARRLLGETTPFDEENRAAFALSGPLPSPPDLTAARAALSAVLPGTGSVHDRHVAFRRRFVVRPERREAVLQAALDACRTTTAAHIALPHDERIVLRLGVVSPWDGFAHYEGDDQSTISLGDHGPLDVMRALTLACHEGYPGHHVQALLVQGTLVHARGWREFELVPAFGPHVLIAEGAAEAGVDLALPPAARRTLYRDQLLPLAGLDPGAADDVVSVEERLRALDIGIPAAAGAYLDGHASRDDTVAALGDLGVVDPDAFVTFVEQRRTLATVYPIGRRLIDAHLQAGGGDPWARLEALFTGAPFALADLGSPGARTQNSQVTSQKSEVRSRSRK